MEQSIIQLIVIQYVVIMELLMMFARYVEEARKNIMVLNESGESLVI